MLCDQSTIELIIRRIVRLKSINNLATIFQFLQLMRIDFTLSAFFYFSLSSSSNIIRIYGIFTFATHMFHVLLLIRNSSIRFEANLTENVRACM